MKQPIEWTEKRWNPVRGCTRVSEGCRNCYAERMATRNLPGMNSPTTGEPFAIMTPSGPRWTGKVELIESKLTEPLRWRKPQRVFVTSMSDLFHGALPARAIDAIFAVMAQSPQHTFQILTKRPRPMLEYMRAEWTPDGINEAATRFGMCHANLYGRWPLPNVWLGVSVEDQATADDRIPLLLQTPAAVRFVSYEPALAVIDFRKWLRGQCPQCHGFDDWCADVALCETCRGLSAKGIDWLICGGESGLGARPFDIAWARSVRDQCKAAGVPFFMKQLGAKPVLSREADGAFVPDYEYIFEDRKGGAMEEWPEDLRIREYPRIRTATAKS